MGVSYYTHLYMYSSSPLSQGTAPRERPEIEPRGVPPRLFFLTLCSSSSSQRTLASGLRRVKPIAGSTEESAHVSGCRCEDICFRDYGAALMLARREALIGERDARYDVVLERERGDYGLVSGRKIAWIVSSGIIYLLICVYCWEVSLRLFVRFSLGIVYTRICIIGKGKILLENSSVFLNQFF